MSSTSSTSTVGRREEAPCVFRQGRHGVSSSAVVSLWNSRLLRPAVRLFPTQGRRWLRAGEQEARLEPSARPVGVAAPRPPRRLGRQARQAPGGLDGEKGHAWAAGERASSSVEDSLRVDYNLARGMIVRRRESKGAAGRRAATLRLPRASGSGTLSARLTSSFLRPSTSTGSLDVSRGNSGQGAKGPWGASRRGPNLAARAAHRQA